MRNIIVFILLFLSAQFAAQPGGGGGLRVLNVYDEHKRPIDVEQLKIKLLRLDSMMNIIAERDISSEHNFHVGRDGKKMIALPPSDYFSNTQGLVITYKNKDYRFDFKYIIKSNGAGHVEEIDSLVLFKPYVLRKRTYGGISINRKEYYKFYLLHEIAYKCLDWGVTPETYKRLSAIDLMFDAPEYAYNYKPKPWMESFKQLYADYTERNKHNKEEYADYLKRIDEMISKYGDLEPFAILKMRFLYKGAYYKEFISYYEKKPAGYRGFFKEAKQIYHDLKEYDKGIVLAKERASVEKGKSERYFRKFDYISYNFDWLFIKSYYKNKSIKNELESFVSKIDLDKDGRFYSGMIFKRFEELKRYDSYRGKKKLTDKEKEQKKCMEANLLEVFKEGCIWCNDFEDCLKD